MTEPQIEAGSSQTAQIETEHQISLTLEINSLILHVTKNLNYRNTDPRPGLHFSQGEAAAWADPPLPAMAADKTKPSWGGSTGFYSLLLLLGTAHPWRQMGAEHLPPDNGSVWVVASPCPNPAGCPPHRRCRSCCPPTADGRLEEDGAAPPATGSSLQSQPGEGRRAPSELSQRRQQPGLCAPFALSL